MPATAIARTQTPISLWPSVAMIMGGSVNAALWPIFTSLHGPTSVDRQGEFLGMGTLFWGSMMEGPSGLLIALGLLGSYALLTERGGRMARTGFVLAMIGSVIPAVVNLVIVAVMPPLLTPVFAAGLILVAVANRDNPAVPRFSRRVLVGLGVILVYSFLWMLLVRPEMLDQIDGYRIYGIVASLLYGVAWIAFGVSIMAGRGRTAGAPVASA